MSATDRIAWHVAQAQASALAQTLAMVDNAIATTHAGPCR